MSGQKKQPLDPEKQCRASVAVDKWDPDGDQRQCKRPKVEGSDHCAAHTKNPPVWWKR